MSKQPIRRLMQSLGQLASPEHCLFTPDDLRALLPDLSAAAFKTMLSRAVKEGHLVRMCRGLYLFEKAAVNNGLLLHHAAARLRADDLNYISLESALSDAGVISQMPINRISLMSSGRSSVISCGRWGTIEFIRTRQRPEDLAGQIFYDADCKLWRASVKQALRDMRATQRNLDLIDWSAVDESV
jgi:hypothetical protein